MRMQKLVKVSLVLVLCGSVGWHVRANDAAADWGGSRGSAPFQFAFIGDMPYGAELEGQFVNLSP